MKLRSTRIACGYHPRRGGCPDAILVPFLALEKSTHLALDHWTFGFGKLLTGLAEDLAPRTDGQRECDAFFRSCADHDLFVHTGESDVLVTLSLIHISERTRPY